MRFQKLIRRLSEGGSWILNFLYKNPPLTFLTVFFRFFCSAYPGPAVRLCAKGRPRKPAEKAQETQADAQAGDNNVLREV